MSTAQARYVAGDWSRPSEVLVAVPLQRPPAMAITLNKRVGVFRAFASRRIIREIRRWKLRPGFFDGSDDSPLGLDLVATGEQSRITAHRVEQKGLVSDWSGGSERVAIGEVHVDAAGAHMRARSFGLEIQRDALVGLNAHGDDIVMDVIRVSREQRLRRALEVDRNFRKLVRQPFAGADVKGNSRPTPVIYAEFHGDVGFGERLGIDAWLLAIAREHRLRRSCPAHIARGRFASLLLPPSSDE